MFGFIQCMLFNPGRVPFVPLRALVSPILREKQTSLSYSEDEKLNNLEFKNKAKCLIVP